MSLSLEHEYLILEKQGDIEIKKARLKAYIEEQSKLIVNSMYTEDGEEDDTTDAEKNVEDNDRDADGNPTGKGVLAKIFGAIGNMLTSILNTIKSIFNGTSVSDEILADPNKKVEFGYNPDQMTEAAYQQITTDCKLLKDICNITGAEPEDVAGITDNVIKAASFAGGLFSCKQLFGWFKNMVTRADKTKKEVEDAEKIVNANYEKMTSERRKKADKILTSIKSLVSNNITSPLALVFDQIRDNAVNWFKKGIFDDQTPEPIKTKYKGLNPDDYVPKDIIAHMKIVEKYKEVEKWIVSPRDKDGNLISATRKVMRNGKEVTSIDPNRPKYAVGIGGENDKKQKYDEQEVKKNFDAFIARVQRDPNHLKKSEIETFFGDLAKIKNHKRLIEQKIARDDAKIKRANTNEEIVGQANSRYKSTEQRRNAQRNADLAAGKK